MPDYAGYLQLRRALFEHLRDGRLSHLEALAFIYITAQADSRSGIWVGSAGALAGELGIPLRTAGHLLESLTKKTYLRRFAKPGSRFCYPILVNKYLVTNGEQVGKVLNATATSDWRFPVYEENGQLGEFRGERPGKQLAGQREIRTENREKTKATHRRSAPGTVESADDGFEKFYSAYPIKRARLDAHAAWLKLSPDDRLAAVAGLERWKHSEDWARDAGRFIPYPTTFLRSRRWEDEIPAPVKGANGGDHGAVDRSDKPSGTLREILELNRRTNALTETEGGV